MLTISQLDDQELYRKCKYYGASARMWMRKFVGLLPEVYNRSLYKRKGYASIHEFGAKLAGMNFRMVDKILNLAQKIDDKPHLKAQFEHGMQGWSKIEAVAYIATPETDAFWAKKVEDMPKQALQLYVQEKRKIEGSQFTAGGELLPVNSGGNLGVTDQRWASWENTSTLFFKVSKDLEHQLRLFKQKMEHERKETLGWAAVVEELLKGYQENLEDLREPKSSGNSDTPEHAAPHDPAHHDHSEKSDLPVCIHCAEQEAMEKTGAEASSRHIPVAVKKYISILYKNRCAFPGCSKPSEILHHTRRFGLNQSHDPRFIVPLCKAHERLIHTGLIENEEASPMLWRIKEEPDRTSPKFLIDQHVALYRGGAP